MKEHPNRNTITLANGQKEDDSKYLEGATFELRTYKG